MLKGVKIGLGITGSFCTFEKLIPVIQKMKDEGANIIPIITPNVLKTDTRFGKAKDFIETLKNITGNNIIDSIFDAEPLGPNNMIDVMVIAPCTGN